MKRKHLYRKPDPRNAALVRVYFRHPKCLSEEFLNHMNHL